MQRDATLSIPAMPATHTSSSKVMCNSTSSSSRVQMPAGRVGDAGRELHGLRGQSLAANILVFASSTVSPRESLSLGLDVSTVVSLNLE